MDRRVTTPRRVPHLHVNRPLESRGAVFEISFENVECRVRSVENVDCGECGV